MVVLGENLNDGVLSDTEFIALFFYYSSARSQLTQSRVDFSVCIKIFQYIGPEVWNFLPLYVRHSSSLSSFK